MIEYTVPELLRVNLTSTILQLKAMGIHDVINFGYMEPPEQKSLLEGLKTLYLLSAIDEKGYITPLGKILSTFPLEPSYSKSLILSKMYGVSDLMVDLVSLLSSE